MPQLDYLDPQQARQKPGLRLVLTQGVPGPWGEAAKAIFHVKKLDYLPVRQVGGEANDELVAWTGQANAPQAVYGDEPSRTGWHEILLLAERLAPEPPLLPRPPRLRALTLGLALELCGQDGLGWNRRLQLLHPMLSLPDADTHPGLETVRRLGRRYGYSADAATRAERRVVEILGVFAAQRAEQKAAGSDYLVGDALSCLDLYWATFAALLQPLPAEQCPMPDMLRQSYGSLTPAVAEALDPALLAHRDFVYERFLELPLRF